MACTLPVNDVSVPQASLTPRLQACCDADPNFFSNVQEEQLREAHLDADVNWDKFASRVMEQMEHQTL